MTRKTIAVLRWEQVLHPNDGIRNALHEGVKPLLETLQNDGCKIVIYSTNPETTPDMIQRLLRSQNIAVEERFIFTSQNTPLSSEKNLPLLTEANKELRKSMAVFKEIMDAEFSNLQNPNDIIESNNKPKKVDRINTPLNSDALATEVIQHLISSSDEETTDDGNHNNRIGETVKIDRFMVVTDNADEILELNQKGIATIKLRTKSPTDLTPDPNFYDDVLTAIRCGDKKELVTRLRQAAENLEGGNVFAAVTGFGLHNRWTGATLKAWQLRALAQAIDDDKSTNDLVELFNNPYTQGDLKRKGVWWPYGEIKEETITAREVAKRHRLFGLLSEKPKPTNTFEYIRRLGLN